VTPQVRISYRLSAACAAAGVLMAMGGLTGGGSVNASQAPSGQLIEAPLVKVVQTLPVTPQLAETHQPVATQSPVTPRPVEPQSAQKPQPPQEAQAAQKSPCAVQPAGPSPVHRGEPGYRPWIDDDHDGSACER
jgi:micrococcal nuclease